MWEVDEEQEEEEEEERVGLVPFPFGVFPATP